MEKHIIKISDVFIDFEKVLKIVFSICPLSNVVITRDSFDEMIVLVPGIEFAEDIQKSLIANFKVSEFPRFRVLIESVSDDYSITVKH